MLSLDRTTGTNMTLAAAAILIAGVGLVLTSAGLATTPVAYGLFATSVALSAATVARVAYSVRRIQLENEGLIEEVSQEFERVRDRFSIVEEALVDPRPVETQASEDPAAPKEETPMRRVMVK